MNPMPYLFRIVLPPLDKEERKDWLIREKIIQALKAESRDKTAVQTTESQDDTQKIVGDDDSSDSPTEQRIPRRRAKTYRVNPPKPTGLKLWTHQKYEVWERLRSEGSLFVRHDNGEPPDYVDEYDWMRDQMASRLTAYEGHYPFWAYHRPKIDLRKPNAFPQGTPDTLNVRLELSIPADRVLLFSDEAWLMVLNRWYIPLSESEDEAWVEVVEREGFHPLDQNLTGGLGALMVQSWERIFDLENLCAEGLWSPNYVQAVFERLDLANVVSVTEYVARDSKGY
jgi:hypothetical protein